MRFFLFVVLAWVLWGSEAKAQDSLHIYIPEVVISDHLFKDYNQTQKIQKITDSIIKKSPNLLTSLLNYHTLVFFKENGLGGASSPSFRGTTAQQTAVVWNGININSQLLGQADFNTLNSMSSDNIAVKSGGGSVGYGSSAIGGSIHLNDELYFYDHTDFELLARYGSFKTKDVFLKSKLASERYSLSVGLGQSSSENDYPWVGRDRKNLNGAYHNSVMKTAFGYKITPENTVKFYGNFTANKRHFSLIIPTETPTKYDNKDFKGLLEWVNLSGAFTSRTKLAYLSEAYKYFPNIAESDYTYGEVSSLIAKYDLNYKISEKIQTNIMTDFTQNNGKGSDIKSESRRVMALGTMFRHSVSDKLYYEAALRKEISSDYPSPWLYSLGANYRIASFYSIKIHTSKNFRMPTFNDLYWQNSGNPDLKPEVSYQVELTQSFQIGRLSLSATVYHNDITDMLRWLPEGAVWRPVNTDKVRINGLELGSDYSMKIGSHHIELRLGYGYTLSKDKKTGNYLVYVPKHKANGSVAYHYKGINAYAEWLAMGEIFTRSDNKPQHNLKGYQLFNIGTDYAFMKHYTVGFKIQNLANVYYETVESRPLPGRSFSGYLMLKF